MKTVKVRIAVVINTEGKWSAAGWSIESDIVQELAYDCDAMDTASEVFNDEDTLKKYWIAAKIEMPEEVKIEEIDGEVKGYA